MTRDELITRMLKIKKRLPNGYMEVLVDKFPKYKKQPQRVRSVVALQLVDKSIIDDLEKIAL